MAFRIEDFPSRSHSFSPSLLFCCKIKQKVCLLNHLEVEREEHSQRVKETKQREANACELFILIAVLLFFLWLPLSIHQINSCNDIYLCISILMCSIDFILKLLHITT